MNTKKTYQGQITVTFNIPINFEKLYTIVYYNILVENGRVDQNIFDYILEEYSENDLYYLNDVFGEDILKYHNHETLREIIKEDFKEWILINKKNG